MLIKFFSEIFLLRKCFGASFAIEYFFRAFFVFPRILKTRSLGPVDQTINSDRVLSAQFKGRNYCITGDMLPTSREIFLKDCYRFDPGVHYKTIIDLGANRGNFSIIAAKYANLVVSVECDDIEMPGIFRKTMALNGVDNVIFENKFISSESDDNHLSLNLLLAKHRIGQVDLIKIDIEGAESDLFGSNIEWLEITKSIAMEVHPCFGVSVSDIENKLKNHGFQVEITDLALISTTASLLRGMGYLFAKKK